MAAERKTVMISARLPASLVARVDFIAKNTEGDIRSRSAALQAALEHWLPEQERTLEKRLEQLGAPSKKAR
jgi:metal-responsive CopG/Arc/MetJ family transcriptional regulator